MGLQWSIREKYWILLFVKMVYFSVYLGFFNFSLQCYSFLSTWLAKLCQIYIYYFISVDAFLPSISISDCPLLTYRNQTDFCIWIHITCILQLFLNILSSSFLHFMKDFSHRQNPLWIGEICFFLSGCFLPPFLGSIIWNRNGESEHFRLVPLA